jgi:hypothetical protein
MAPSVPSFNAFLERRQSGTETETSNGGLSAGAKAGIAIGVIIPILFISYFIFYLYTHNWTIPEERRPRIPQWKPKLPQWRPQMSKQPQSSWRESVSWQRIASSTRQASTVPSNMSSSSKTDVTLTERERPPMGKFWSADEIGPDGEKANTGRSRFSVVAPAEPYEPKVVKAPRPPSIFTSKTSIYGVERNGEPEVVRPSSKQVKTWSRHISAQFGDWGRLPSRRVSEENERDSAGMKSVKETRPEDVPPIPKASNKRDSKSVITNLDWQNFEPQV